jgi:DNA-binding CsgD family transcriptional regulator
MHSKKGTFSSFFTTLQYFSHLDVSKLFTARLLGINPDIQFLIDFIEKEEHLLKTNNSFLAIFDMRGARMLYTSPSVLSVTGYDHSEFLSGGSSKFIKNYCPADRVSGQNFLLRIAAHQKENILDKSHYQYHTTFRFLHKNGYYKWMYNRMMFISHDERNYPWVLISIVTGLDNFKRDDNLNFACLKYNPETALYEKEIIEECEPDYLNILNQTDLNILKLLAQGMDNKQIAKQLKYTENTVKDYRKKMLKKTWCENTAELLAFVLRNGLIL